MATRTLKKGVSTFMNAAGDYEEAALPVSNDSVRIVNGAVDVVSTLSQVALDFLSFYIGPGFKGGWGPADGSSHGRFDVNQGGTGVYTYEGGGPYVFQEAGTGGTIAKLRFVPTGPTKGYFSVGTFTTIEVEAGQCFIQDTAAFTTMYVMGGYVVIENHASNIPTDIHVMGGTVILKRDFVNLHCRGGTVEWDAQGITGGIVNMQGGTLRWKDGDLGNVNGYSGTLDESQLRRPSNGGTRLHTRQLIRKLSNGPMVVTYAGATPIGRGEQTVIV